MKVRTRYEAPEETNIPGIIYLPSVPIVDTEVFEPCRLFDNLYFIGTRFIGTLVVTTREGLVLIDSMNCRRDVEEIIYPGLAKLGLDGEKRLSGGHEQKGWGLYAGAGQPGSGTVRQGRCRISPGYQPCGRRDGAGLWRDRIPFQLYTRPHARRHFPGTACI